MTTMTLTAGTRRMGIDQLMARILEPGFAIRFGGAPSLKERAGHVSPSILQVESSRSKYVSRWRRHLRHCPACTRVYRYFGFPVS